MQIRALPLDLDPWSLFRAFGEKDRPFFFDAGRPWGGAWVSSMGFRPRMQFRVAAADDPRAPLDRLDAMLADVAPSARDRARTRAVPFAGGVVLALAYEAKHAIERLPPSRGEAADAPRLAGAVYDATLSYDHRHRRYLLASWHLDGAPFAALAEEILDAAADARRERHDAPTPAGVVATSLGPAAYTAGVARILDYIAAGDVYQVNFTERFATPLRGTPLDMYGRLRALQPVPFGGYLDLGAEHVLSTSPELFLRRRGARITTCPIKGTRPRGGTRADDLRLRNELRADAKERAEHVMIVDLERNDLGRVCRPGTIMVERLAECVSFDTVHHLVSTVSGTLLGSIDTGALLRATFPSGSITGAPKIRAMEIISELEPVPRGFYTGTIGWIDASGDCDLNVAIRTAVAKDGTLFYSAGGGIVADSHADRERDELHLKAMAFFSAVGALDIPLPTAVGDGP
jgi:para-aminobenzoate synthetase component 1